MRVSVAVAIAVAAFAAAAPAHAAAPAPLSRDASLPSFASTSGSGVFGRWTVDRFGLPAYRYTLDQQRDARARQPELGGSTDAWSQVGNDAIIAAAFNHGYVQLWSQARLSQWANRFDAATGHYAGGFGYLRTGGRTFSTLYLDRPGGARPLREFGVGYARAATTAGALRVDATVTAPFGDDPVVVHEVVLRNPTDRRRRATWFEYWDVNPYDQTTKRQRGLGRPAFDAARRTLRVAQAPTALDRRPLSVFLSALDTRVAGFDTDAGAFFGSGGRAAPVAVREDRARGSRAAPVRDGQVGDTMFALRTPVSVPAHGSVRLRYVYGMAHAGAIPSLVRRARRTRSTVAATARRWGAWVPRAELGAGRRWLARELAWDAYLVRSSSMWDEACGHHVITQGGYYQYGLGQQLAFRDPLQHLLPMVHAAPELAREVLRYSLQEQDRATGEVPYGMGPMCRGVDLGRSNDMDFWLMLAVSEYVLATRDTSFLRERLPYADRRGSGTVLEHLRLAVRHQEAIGRGPGGQYLMTGNGDWSDFSTTFIGLTESTLVTAQLAYVYPRLAQVADLADERAFAAELRALGERDLVALRGQLTQRGWYSRGYRGAEQAGTGVIYGEPQPWAILAGAPDAGQAATLVANTRRYLEGVGAPAALNGPARIGASMSPATDDPDVTERTAVTGVGDRNAVFVGGTWYAINGPLTWALGTLDGTVPGASALALDELERNTLHAHATAYPDHWTGVLDVDDACRSFFSTDPARCGIDVLLDQGGSNGHITHQPAWSLFAALRLAGVQPDRDGYTIAPSLPLRRFSLRLPGIGIAAAPRALRGYVRPVAGRSLVLTLRPRGLPAAARPAAWVAGRRAKATRVPGGVRVTVRTRPGRPVDWALTW
jgi:hypothetical protein